MFKGLFKKNKDDKFYSGALQRYFAIDTLSKLIEPQYKDIQGLSIWVYARVNLEEELTEPTNDQPIFTNTEKMLSKPVFDKLIEGILVPKVIVAPEGAENMIFYSQSVPVHLPTLEDGSPDRSKINLYLIFAIEENESYAKPYLT